jgi:hypothetical protein
MRYNYYIATNQAAARSPWTKTTQGLIAITTNANLFIQNHVLTVADQLYVYQYGESTTGHKIENRELRKLFNKLNDLHETATLTNFSQVTGAHDFDWRPVLRGYRKVFKKFMVAFDTIGFADDSPELMDALKTARYDLNTALIIVDMDY